MHGFTTVHRERLISFVLFYGLFAKPQKKTTECKDAWRRCGINEGFPSPDALRPQKFFTGQSFRDTSCPSVTSGYLTLYEFSFHGRISSRQLTILSQVMA